MVGNPGGSEAIGIGNGSDVDEFCVNNLIKFSKPNAKTELLFPNIYCLLIYYRITVSRSVPCVLLFELFF